MNSIRVTLATALCVVLVGFLPTKANAYVLDEVWDQANKAKDAAQSARDSAKESRDQMREGLEQLSGDMREAIDDAIEEGQLTILEEKAGRQAFLDGGLCEPFRADIVALLQLTDGLLVRVVGLAGLENLDVSLAVQIDKLSNLPCKPLYPLYRTVGQKFKPGESGMLGLLSEMIDSLDEIAEALNPRPAQPTFLAAAAVDERWCDSHTGAPCDTITYCGAIITDETVNLRVNQAVKVLNTGSNLLTLVSKITAANAEIAVEKKVKLAIWGWVGINVKGELGKFLAGYYEVEAIIIKNYVDFVNGELSACADAAAQEQILTAISRIDGTGGTVDLTALLNGQSVLSGQHATLLGNQSTMAASMTTILAEQQNCTSGQAGLAVGLDSIAATLEDMSAAQATILSRLKDKDKNNALVVVP